MNKFLSDIYDWYALAKAGQEEGFTRSEFVFLEFFEYIDWFDSDIQDMGYDSLCRRVYGIEFGEYMRRMVGDKEEFMSNAYCYWDRTEDCIKMALAVGLVESREEATQKYGDSLKELFDLEQ